MQKKTNIYVYQIETILRLYNVMYIKLVNLLVAGTLHYTLYFEYLFTNRNKNVCNNLQLYNMTNILFIVVIVLKPTIFTDISYSYNNNMYYVPITT